jgi:hypothetical protein
MRYDRAVLALLLLAFACAGEQPLPRQVTVPPADLRGPVVGQPLPSLSLPDQDGRLQTLETLRGPKGLLLVLVQSADW